MYSADEKRYDEMIYNRTGRRGLKLPKISLGLWHNFGGVDSYETAKDIVLSAFDHGITHFDLANNYGPPAGSAEITMGKLLKESLGPYRDELILTTKAGWDMWPGPYGDFGSRKYLISSLDQSLKRLGVDYVDIFYSHRYDPNTPLEETMRAISHSIKQGKALYAGISNYPAEKAQEACKILSSEGTPCLIIQESYSLFDRHVEGNLTAVVEKAGIGMSVFCPLAQGLLTDRYINGIPKDSRAAKAHGFLSIDEVNSAVNKINKLTVVAKERGENLAEMSLSWVFNNPQVTTAIVGVSKLSQLKSNIKAMKSKPFADSELKAIKVIVQ